MRHTEDDAVFETVIDHSGQPRRILRNGATTRVPLQFMDSMQRDIAATFGDLEKLRQLRDEAREARELADANAWRGDASKRHCPSCGFDLTSGTDLMRAGNGDEVDDAAHNPHSSRFDLDAARAARAQLYQDVENEQRDAWKKGKY